MTGITKILLCIVVAANARELPQVETSEDLSLARADDVYIVDKVRLFLIFANLILKIFLYDYCDTNDKFYIGATKMHFIFLCNKTFKFSLLLTFKTTSCLLFLYNKLNLI